MEITGLLIAAVLIAVFVVITVARAVRIVPQARARNVERLGRYQRTLQPGLNFVIPYIDRVYPKIDLREQELSIEGSPVECSLAQDRDGASRRHRQGIRP